MSNDEAREILEKNLEYGQGFALSQPRPSEVNAAIKKAIEIFNTKEK